MPKASHLYRSVDWALGLLSEAFTADLPREAAGLRGEGPVLSVALGLPDSGRAMADSHAEAWAWKRRWEQWADGLPVSLEERPRTVSGTENGYPARLTVRDMDSAAAALGAEGELAEARRRGALLREAVAEPVDPVAAARGALAMGAGELGRALDCCRALMERDCSALWARQVRVTGSSVDAKFIEGHLGFLKAMVGEARLPRVKRPTVFHLRWLDPGYLDLRRDDGTPLAQESSVTVGDGGMRPPYEARVLVVCENDDTVRSLPPVEGGVAVFGRGFSVTALAEVPWAKGCPVLLYWGDMDASGLEILAQARRAGLPFRSVAMDMGAYRRWEREGTDFDKKGRRLRPKKPQDTAGLERGEAELYFELCSKECAGHRRVEQEHVAMGELEAVLATLGT